MKTIILLFTLTLMIVCSGCVSDPRNDPSYPTPTRFYPTAVAVNANVYTPATYTSRTFWGFDQYGNQVWVVTTYCGYSVINRTYYCNQTSWIGPSASWSYAGNAGFNGGGNGSFQSTGGNPYRGGPIVRDSGCFRGGGNHR